MMRFRLKSKIASGFTMVELLIGVGIVALLSSIAIPAYVAARSASQRSSFVNELEKTADSFSMFAAEHSQLPPNGGGWSAVPAGMDAYLPKNSTWTSNTDLGGLWYWWKPGVRIWNYDGLILLFGLSVTNEQMLAIDERLDDGNLNDGRLRYFGNGLATFGVK